MAKAILTHGSTVAFSSALPGLAGATLRRDGLYAGLRSPITYREEDGHICPDQGIITVKLFNLLMDELGPKFLSKGFAIEPSSLMRLLHVHADEFPQEVVSVAFDGKRIEPERLMEKSIYGDAQYVIVSVDTEESRTKIISRSALTP
ncbi:MAG TPA: hypothetical protein VMT62_13705 [Syntrophorhabdaceae bacterium]|nr:hypothetical protein [Syntrophorhabdaceae bacterium]